VFNLEELSLNSAKVLPQVTQDDFFELMGYIKEKIAEIKVLFSHAGYTE
jgi:hypothetical protein